MSVLETVLRSILAIGKGAGVTIIISILSFLLGLLVGIPLAIGRAYGNRLTRMLIQAYEGFFRGTPLIVTLFTSYFSCLPTNFSKPSTGS